MAQVSVRNLAVSFGSFTVLQNLNLEVEEGEFLVLLGPSGCGKSTLLNSIAGLLEIDDGQIWIAGDNVTWKEPKDLIPQAVRHVREFLRKHRPVTAAR